MALALLDSREKSNNKIYITAVCTVNCEEIMKSVTSKI
jgi:hypothetical protein